MNDDLMNPLIPSALWDEIVANAIKQINTEQQQLGLEIAAACLSQGACKGGR